MTVATTRVDAVPLPRGTLATTFELPRPRLVPGRTRTMVGVAGDVLGLMAIVLCIPLVILAIGVPIALCVRLVTWLAGLV